MTHDICVLMHRFSTTETAHVVGDINGRRPIIIDDLMAGGSVLRQIDALYERGAEGKACFAVTHPVLLPTALKILDEDERIENLVVTNTIPLSEAAAKSGKVTVLSVSHLLGEAIKRVYKRGSVSELFI